MTGANPNPKTTDTDVIRKAEAGSAKFGPPVAVASRPREAPADTRAGLPRGASSEDFERFRLLLFSTAYRMLGSAAEVEDVVQDSWLRYSAAPPAEIRSPKAYLTTIARRLALDRLKSARLAREQYIGPWLLEPVLTEGQPVPERSLVLAESLTLAFMVLLDTLSPEEREVFLLREMLESSYPEIASVLGVSEANCRQLFRSDS